MKFEKWIKAGEYCSVNEAVEDYLTNISALAGSLTPFSRSRVPNNVAYCIARLIEMEQKEVKISIMEAIKKDELLNHVTLCFNTISRFGETANPNMDNLLNTPRLVALESASTQPAPSKLHP